LLAGCAFPLQLAAAELSAGHYTFSDKLGGFRLLSATGVGTADDPIIVVEEVDDPAPITLVVRRQIGSLQGRSGIATLTLEKVVINRSRRVWAGFEIELQEVFKRPSGYSDGLSFNQIGPREPDVRSDSFGENKRLFEPSDRIRFESGFVDPEATARFRMTITDPTPDVEFYIIQDPKLLLSSRPPGRNRFAER
jgi:hypothetical protein